MRMIVWSRGQALAVLSMILGLTMGVTALLLWSPGGRPPEEDAVAAFAAGSLFTMDENAGSNRRRGGNPCILR